MPTGPASEATSIRARKIRQAVRRVSDAAQPDGRLVAKAERGGMLPIAAPDAGCVRDAWSAKRLNP